MLEVVIVGERNSGKTTFLGLLYATQVRFGSDKADSLRFHATIESLEMITLVYQQLMSGTFPDPVTKQAIGDMSFQLGYRRGRAGKDWSPDEFTTIHLTLKGTGVGGTHRPQSSSSVTGGGLNGRDGSSDVVVVLVDSTKLAAKGEPAEPGPLSSLDGAVASLLAGIQRPSDRGARLYPIIILSKFDRVRPEALRTAQVAAAPPAARDARRRAAYTEALLSPNLPRTLAILRSREKDRSGFAKPAYLFSWVRTETAPGVPDRIRLRRIEVAGWEPDYSSSECLSFLGYLADISAHSGH